MQDPAFWAGRRVLLTGHTGFKGSWLLLWLQQLGDAEWTYAFEPESEPNLFRQLAQARPAGESWQLQIGALADLDALKALVLRAHRRLCCTWPPSPWCGAATRIRSAPGPPT